MASVLLVGGPGSGKSSVASALHTRCLHSIDLDYGYARWEDSHGLPTEFPTAPDMAWLTEHHWQWIADRLGNALDETRSHTGVLCGAAHNMNDYLELFDLLILLQIDDATLQSRVTDPQRNNDFGQVGDTLTWSRAWRPQLEEDMLRRGARPVDARRPVSDVVNEVIEICRSNGTPISKLTARRAGVR